MTRTTVGGSWLMNWFILRAATIISITKKDMDNGQIILFQTQGGETKIEVRLANESVWLTADQMAELFHRDRSTIQRHIKRIYGEGELKPESTCASYYNCFLSTDKYTCQNTMLYTGLLPSFLCYSFGCSYHGSFCFVVACSRIRYKMCSHSTSMGNPTNCRSTDGIP